MLGTISFAIHTLGCKVNTYESDAMSESLRNAGYTERSFEEPADIYIINTCTVTNVADRKSRQMLRRARKLNPGALIVAAGCYVDDASKNGRLEELIENGVIDVAVPNREKNKIAEILRDRLQMQGAECPGGGESPEAPRGMFLTKPDGHTRAFLKVQDGCNMFCTYCVIPYVRGRLQARPAAEVLEEVKRLADNGVAETVLTGIHLSSLGTDLLRLVEGIEGIDGIRRVRLGSLEPTLITRSFAREMSGYGKLCPHFHLSLQSGSDTVLKRMNRHYTAAGYEESCGILREFYEHPAITTDIIVGFPQETEEEFGQTLALAERVGFYEAHVFKYSRRKGTVADRMEGQIPEPVKGERSEELIRLCQKLSHKFREYYVGKETAFLSEELIQLDGVTYETGYNREYVRCVKATQILHSNDIIVGKSSHIVQQNDIDESLFLV